jgi:16S rRNA (guanine1207-N2)-methyltransferase
MNSQYNLKLKSQENGKIYSFQTADGLNSKNRFREEEILIADTTKIQKEDKILVIQSNYGFLGTILGDKAQKMVMQDTSARARQYSKQNAEQNQIQNFEALNKPFISEIQQDNFDKIFYAPKEYTPIDLVRKRLAEATKKLNSKGEIIIAGKNKTGIKRYKKHLKQLGKIEKIGKRKNLKTYKSTPQKTPEKIKLTKNYTAKLKNKEAHFQTSKGLFSPRKLDKGTKTLLKNIQKVEGKVLDVGCGYGTISVFLAKQNNCKLFLTDDNARATYYARKNLETNNINNYKVETGDCLDPFTNQKFDYIVSNPPTHQGQDITNKIFQQSHQQLNQNGELWIVYNQNMNYQEKIQKIFNKTEIKAKKDKFKVLKAKK